MRFPLLCCLGALFLPACRGDEAAPAAPLPAAGVVDSVVPISVALARFRADLPGAPAGLRGGANGRDSLVDALVRALGTADERALERLAVDRAEYAYLYYPTARIAQPSYELPPALAWFQLQEANRKGVLRAFHRLAGHEPRLERYDCDPDPVVEGPNRLWVGCRVTLVLDGADTVSLRLFGSILERGGRFEVLSFANDY